jgi:chromosome segregation ATPase
VTRTAFQRETALESELERLKGKSAGRIEELTATIDQLRGSLADLAGQDKGVRGELASLREDKLRLTAKVNSLQEVGPALAPLVPAEQALEA